MKRKDVIRNALQAVGEFNDRRPWKRFTNFDCFAVKVSGQDKSMLGVILGAAGEEYGLSLFRGPNAASCLGGLFDLDGPGDDPLQDAPRGLPDTRRAAACHDVDSNDTGPDGTGSCSGSS